MKILISFLFSFFLCSLNVNVAQNCTIPGEVRLYPKDERTCNCMSNWSSIWLDHYKCSPFNAGSYSLVKNNGYWSALLPAGATDGYILGFVLRSTCTQEEMPCFMFEAEIWMGGTLQSTHDLCVGSNAYQGANAYVHIKYWAELDVIPGGCVWNVDPDWLADDCNAGVHECGLICPGTIFDCQ